MPLPAVITALGAGFSFSTFFKATVIWLVANIFCKLIYRALFSLGIGVIAFAGVDFMLDQVFDLIQNHMSNLSGSLRGLLDRARVPDALGIISSAASFAITTKLARSFIGFRGEAGTTGTQRW